MVVTKNGRGARARVACVGSSPGEGDGTSNRPERQTRDASAIAWRAARRSNLPRGGSGGCTCRFWVRVSRGGATWLARGSSPRRHARPRIPRTNRAARAVGRRSSRRREKVRLPARRCHRCRPHPRARAKPVLCTSIYPSARDHPIPLASATYIGAHIHVPSLMSLERGRPTRARVRFRWTHSPRPRTSVPPAFSPSSRP
jgi:hypothetical protein